MLASGESGGESVLALPLNRLLVKMVRVPPGSDAVEIATPILQAMNPFPDEALTVSCEVVREDGDGNKVVLAAALPESAADDIAEALDTAKLSVVRIDALVLGQLRGIWSALGESSSRRLIIVRSADCLSLVVLDGSEPSAIRATNDATDLRREVFQTLLEAEDFGGARKLGEIVLVENDKSDEKGQDALAEENPFATLAGLAPIRHVTVGADAALVGVAERSQETGVLNALPESWREVLEETRFKRKLRRYLTAAGMVWALAIAVLIGVPFVYDLMTDHQKSLSRQHQRQYAAVKEMKAKVDLIHKYSDHARGALEIMKAVSDRLPEGITLSSWTYKRDDGVRVSGEAEGEAEPVYVFKDSMDALAAGDDEDGERIFGEVILNGPNKTKNVHRFDLECQYGHEEED